MSRTPRSADAWIKVIDDDGDEFYYNPATEESAWEVPPHTPAVLPSSPPPPPSPTAPTEPAPPQRVLEAADDPWIAVEQDGEEFFYNRDTGESSWVKPSASAHTTMPSSPQPLPSAPFAAAAAAAAAAPATTAPTTTVPTAAPAAGLSVLLFTGPGGQDMPVATVHLSAASTLGEARGEVEKQLADKFTSDAARHFLFLQRGDDGHPTQVPRHMESHTSLRAFHDALRIQFVPKSAFQRQRFPCPKRVVIMHDAENIAVPRRVDGFKLFETVVVSAIKAVSDDPVAHIGKVDCGVMCGVAVVAAVAVGGVVVVVSWSWGACACVRAGCMCVLSCTVSSHAVGFFSPPPPPPPPRRRHA